MKLRVHTVTAVATQVQIARITSGTAVFRRFNLAMFSAGLATFALLYAPQPVLPLLGRAFGESPVGASLVISAATLALAVAVIPIASVSEVVGRKPVMIAGVGVASALGVVVALAPGFGAILALRALQGVAMAGVPAAAMAHVTEEVEPAATGRAMGLYIAGNGVGGMTGRLIVGGVTDLAGWRWGLAAVGVFSFVCAAAFWALLPRAVAFRPQPARPRALAASVLSHLRSVRLLRLYLTAFALMGATVTVYNYIGYRLVAPPFGLSTTAVGLIFLCYLGGSASSTTAGRLADRFGRRPIATIGALGAVGGVCVTLASHLAAVICGLLLFTAGFFACHAVASGWVGRLATGARAQASALYMLAYYLGSSVAGSVGGVAYTHAGWAGTAAFVAGLMVIAVLAVQLRSRQASPEGHSTR